MIARIASAQRGLVTREQLLRAGLPSGTIDDRLRRGNLHRVQRGVYLPGHAVPPPFARELAAVLSSGRGTLIARRSALHLWGLAVEGIEDEAVSVLVVGRRVRTRAGLVARRAGALARSDATRRHGIPVTTAARTVVDLAADLSGPDLEDLVHELQVRRLASPAAMRAALVRAGNPPGAPRLRPLLVGAERGVTRNRAERRLGEVLRAARLPEPETNVRVLRFEVDVLWRRERVVAEFDGFAVHGTRRAFEADRARDADLLAAGYRVVRITWRQLRDEPMVVAARVAAILAAAG